MQIAKEAADEYSKPPQIMMNKQKDLKYLGLHDKTKTEVDPTKISPISKLY